MGPICIHAREVEEIRCVDSDRLDLRARRERHALIEHAFDVSPGFVDFTVGQWRIELHHAELLRLTLHICDGVVFADTEGIFFEFFHGTRIIERLGGSQWIIIEKAQLSLWLVNSRLGLRW